MIKIINLIIFIIAIIIGFIAAADIISSANIGMEQSIIFKFKVGVNTLLLILLYNALSIAGISYSLRFILKKQK